MNGRKANSSFVFLRTQDLSKYRVLSVIGKFISERLTFVLPSSEDVAVFREHLLPGRTLLLGCTKQLMPFSDVYLDTDPWYEGPQVIKKSWLDNTDHYVNILGDGVLNFTKELCDGVLAMASTHCNRLIARAFNYKYDSMRIAAYFPDIEAFPIRPTEAVALKEYSFYIWTF